MGLRVLVAEDNPVNQKLARRMLEKWGCEVDVAADGREAVVAWEAGRYDVILMDVQMPVLDGYESTAEIRRSESAGRARTPIIAMTAHALEGDEERCRAAGMDDYVSKPVKPEALQAALARWSSAAPAAAPAPARPAEPVFDADALDEFCGSDPEFRREILTDFLALAPQLLGRMERSLETSDPGELASASHSLKGSSRSLGATALGNVCQELETLGREQALDAARASVERARQEFARLQAALRPYVGAHDLGTAD